VSRKKLKNRPYDFIKAVDSIQHSHNDRDYTPSMRCLSPGCSLPLRPPGPQQFWTPCLATKLVLENDRVTVYRVSIDPKQSTGIRSRTLPWLRVSITQSTISVQGPGKSPGTIETKAGDYRWHEGATTDSIENIGSTRYKGIEIEWK
jgi:hypothetical protein